MSNVVVEVKQDKILNDLVNTQNLVLQLMQTKHYRNMGEMGIFAIVQKAKSVGIDVFDALNGMMYFVNGKVELSANAMNYLIRASGHSITKCPSSDNTHCVLIGRRADNNDTLSASFSIDEAKKAGIYRGVWERYTQDMLFARALSRLGRQLFPDVLKGCYVEGELQILNNQSSNVELDTISISNDSKNKTYATDEQIDELVQIMLDCDQQFRDEIKQKMKSLRISVKAMPIEFYDKLIVQAKQKRDDLKSENHINSLCSIAYTIDNNQHTDNVSNNIADDNNDVLANILDESSN